jgi:DNA polymerase elongation subunit (family B)
MKTAPSVEARQPKILLLDIETAPILGYAWGIREVDLIHVIEPTYILCYAYKWLDKPTVHTRALCDFRGYKRNRKSDKALVQSLWDILDEADVVIAHNGDAFDIKKINSRFAVHGLAPPTPYKSIDTLKISRAAFKFDSNKLDNIGRYLEVGNKLPHTGVHLWLGCMNGDRASWKMMKDYNAQDVRLLEAVYEQLKPWAKNHPILTAITPRKNTSCPVCLSSDVQSRGFNIAKFKKTPRFQCQPCGHWFSGTGHLPKAA